MTAVQWELFSRGGDVDPTNDCRDANQNANDMLLVFF